MSRIRKTAVLANARYMSATVDGLFTARGATTPVTAGPPAVVYPFPTPPAITIEAPPRGARIIARVATALGRVGFLDDGESRTAEVLTPPAQYTGPVVVDLRFYPCGMEFGCRTWSGKASALLDILHDMTDGSGSDERLAVTFFIAAGDILTAVAIDADLRAAAWRRSCRTFGIANSCAAAELTAAPAEALEKKPKARGVNRR